MALPGHLASALSMVVFSWQILGFGVSYFNTFFLKEPLWNKSLYSFLPGYLKVQDRGADLVWLVDHEGNRTKIGQGELKHPNDVAVDLSGNILVMDTGLEGLLEVEVLDVFSLGWDGN